MAKVTIVNGPTRVEVENGDATTVRALIAAVRDELNIPVGVNTLLNGAAVEDDAILEDGDELAFTKPTGQKGS